MAGRSNRNPRVENAVVAVAVDGDACICQDLRVLAWLVGVGDVEAVEALEKPVRILARAEPRRGRMLDETRSEMLAYFRTVHAAKKWTSKYRYKWSLL